MTSPQQHQRRTIREALAYLRDRHGFQMARATFWRQFLPPVADGMTEWGGTLERRGPNIACTFSRTDVDRMALAYAAYRRGSCPWYARDANAAPVSAVRSPHARLLGP